MAYRQTATTAEFTYILNTADYGGDATITVVGVLESGEEMIIVCPEHSSGGSRSNLYIDGQQVKITPTNSMVRITGNAILKIMKSTTTNDVGFRIA